MDHADLIARIGANVRRIRLAAGVSQCELAERSGLKAPYLSRVELGRRSPPNIVTLVRIADALGVKVCELVDSPPPPPKPPRKRG